MNHLLSQTSQEQTSNPTTFSTNNIFGGCLVWGISSRILRKENARASPDCFWRPNQYVNLIHFLQSTKQSMERKHMRASTQTSGSSDLVECRVDKVVKEATCVPHSCQDQQPSESQYYPIVPKIYKKTKCKGELYKILGSKHKDYIVKTHCSLNANCQTTTRTHKQ